MKILLFGKNGQVGWDLHRSLQPLGEVIALGRGESDFSNPESLRDVIRKVKPDVIVNAVAYTAVDEAEKNHALAAKINGLAPGVLAEEAFIINALLVHYSTDYVFDGLSGEPYTETDLPGPINIYGHTKLAGEDAIKSSGCEYLILRTSWVFSARGSNFLKTIMRLAKEREEISVVDDQYGAPTWSRNIADVTALILLAVRLERGCGTFKSGVYHLCATGKTTWCGFADAIVKRLGQIVIPNDIVIKSVLPITTDSYPLPAQRPKNSQLNTSALNKRFGIMLPDWSRGLELCMDEFMES